MNAAKSYVYYDVKLKKQKVMNLVELKSVKPAERRSLDPRSRTLIRSINLHRGGGGVGGDPAMIV